MSTEVDFVLGTGNVFHDLGDPNHVVKHTKALLAADIVSALDNGGLPVYRAAETTGLVAAHLSRIRNADLGQFTIGYLTRILSVLDSGSNAGTLIAGLLPGPERSR